MKCTICGKIVCTVYPGDICPDCWDKKRDKLASCPHCGKVMGKFTVINANLSELQILHPEELKETIDFWVCKHCNLKKEGE